VGRERERADELNKNGVRALILEHYEEADRYFRLTRDFLGQALVAIHTKAWERALNRALAAPFEKHIPEDQSLLLKVLAIAKDRLSEERADPREAARRAALLARAEPRLAAADWATVNRHVRQLARHEGAGRVYGPLVTVRMSSKLLREGLGTAVQLLLDGNEHSARYVASDLRFVAPEAGLDVAWALCGHCLEYEREQGDRRKMQTIADLVHLTLSLLDFEPDTREHAFLLGVAAANMGELLAERGDPAAKQVLERAEAFLKAVSTVEPLGREAWEGRADRFTAYLNFLRGRVAGAGGKRADARRSFEATVAAGVAPWLERAQERLKSLQEQEDRETGALAHRALLKRWEEARLRGDGEAERAALLEICSDPSAEVQHLERLALLVAASRAPGWVEHASEALRRGSASGELARSLGEEADRRWMAGSSGEALALFRLARRPGPLPEALEARFIALLALSRRETEAARASEALGRVNPRWLVDAASYYRAAGQESRAVAVVQLLAASAAATPLLVEGFRLVQAIAPPDAVRGLAEAILARDPYQAHARAALTRLEVEAHRKEAEAEEQIRNEAAAGANSRDWLRVRRSLGRLPPTRLTGEDRLLLGRALEALSEPDGALEVCGPMPPTPEVLGLRARCLGHLRLWGEARQTLEMLTRTLPPEEVPALGDNPNLLGLVRELRGDLRGAASMYNEEPLLRDLITRARSAGDTAAELEASFVLSGMKPKVYREGLLARVRALETVLPLRDKARYAPDAFPRLILCDTNILFTRAAEGVALPRPLEGTATPDRLQRFERLQRNPKETRLAVTDTVALELRGLVIGLAAVQRRPKAKAALGEVQVRAEALAAKLSVTVVAKVSPQPETEDFDRVLAFYARFKDRVQALTDRKARRDPKRAKAIRKKRRARGGVDGPLPEDVDMAVLAEAAWLARRPLPGFGGVGILSADQDFQHFAADIRREFGVDIY